MKRVILIDSALRPRIKETDDLSSKGLLCAS
jgi:hypothetical protein